MVAEICSRLPAYAGLMNISLNIYCVNCGSNCACDAVDDSAKVIMVKTIYFNRFIIFFFNMLFDRKSTPIFKLPSNDQVS
jgi:hypothetical protein